MDKQFDLYRLDSTEINETLFEDSKYEQALLLETSSETTPEKITGNIYIINDNVNQTPAKASRIDDPWINLFFKNIYETIKSWDDE